MYNQTASGRIGIVGYADRVNLAKPIYELESNTPR